MMNAERWNSLYPVGTLVDYEPISGEGNFRRTRTRSEAWELGNGHTVVSVEGKPGGVSVQHLTVIVEKTAPEKGNDDEPDPRAETGPMQFGNDWPGVFIRGDNAMHYGMVLYSFLDKVATSDAIVGFAKVEESVLRDLCKQLHRANAMGGMPAGCAVLKPYAECVDKKVEG